jgi:hypothetical protein
LGLFPIGDQSSSVVIPALIAQGADKIASIDICGAIYRPGGPGNVAQIAAEQAIGEDTAQDILPATQPTLRCIEDTLSHGSVTACQYPLPLCISEGNILDSRPSHLYLLTKEGKPHLF